MEVLEAYKDELAYVEGEVTKNISRLSPYPLSAASKQLLAVGGKRIRPILVVLAFRSLDNDTDISYAAPIAVATELIHTATLVHDDIIDHSSKRRGVETVYKKWGDVTAILTGDLLFSKAFGLVGVHPIKELTEIISETCIKLAEGEMLEYRHTGNTSMTEEIYLEIIERKTASLFEACTCCGALLGGGKQKEINALKLFGRYLGISFQVVDDILDITGGDKFGKPLAIDIRERKVTIAALHALKNVKGTQRTMLSKAIKKKLKTKKDIETVAEIIKRTGSLDYAAKRAEWYAGKAEKQLEDLPESDAKAALLSIAKEAAYRPF